MFVTLIAWFERMGTLCLVSTPIGKGITFSITHQV
jgi:hypothetical protein